MVEAGAELVTDISAQPQRIPAQPHRIDEQNLSGAHSVATPGVSVPLPPRAESKSEACTQATDRVTPNRVLIRVV